MNKENEIMSTYIDDLFNERLYKIFKDQYGYNDDEVVNIVNEWKENHKEDVQKLKDEFYDELHGTW